MALVLFGASCSFACYCLLCRDSTHLDLHLEHFHRFLDEIVLILISVIESQYFSFKKTSVLPFEVINHEPEATIEVFYAINRLLALICHDTSLDISLQTGSNRLELSFEILTTLMKSFDESSPAKR